MPWRRSNGQHTVASVGSTQRWAWSFLGVGVALCAFFWPVADDIYAGIQDTDDWAVLQRAMEVDGVESAAGFIFRFHAGYFVPFYYTLYLLAYVALGSGIYPAMKVAALIGHAATIMGVVYLCNRNLAHAAAGWMAAGLFGTCFGMFGLLRYPFGLDKILGLTMVMGALVCAELFRTRSQRRWIVVSGVLCLVAPATSALGIVGAPLSLVYGAFVARIRGRKLVELLVVYTLALACYIVPYLLLHGSTMVRYLARDPRGSGRPLLSTSPTVVARWVWSILKALPVKEKYVVLYQRGSAFPWVKYAPMASLAAVMIAGVGGLAAALRAGRGPAVVRMGRYGVFCLLGIVSMILVVGVPRFSLVRTVGEFLGRHRWQSMNQLFFSMLAATVAAPALWTLRRWLGRSAPWVATAVLTIPTLSANRVALGAYDRARERNEPRPLVSSLIRDIRRVQRIASARAEDREETFLPTCLLPSLSPGARHRMSLKDLDRFLLKGRPSRIHWVKRMRPEHHGTALAILERAPALLKLYEDCYPGLFRERGV